MDNPKKKMTLMVRAVLLSLMITFPMTGVGQRLLTLDSCRAMALRNNKQMSVAKTKQEVAAEKRYSARTQSLPRVNAIGTYQFTSRAISLLSDGQKGAFRQMGTTLGTSLQQRVAGAFSQLSPQTIQAMQQMGLTVESLGQLAGQGISQLETSLNGVGQKLVDALDTDSRHLFAGAITVTQPLYMGGAIEAANKMADINVVMADNSLEAQRQSILYRIDNAYWQVVSLRQKQKLAQSFLSLVRKLKDDVKKMIDKGVATKGDGLTMAVRENEAEMALTQVGDGLELSKMLLCQLCGLPIGEQVTLADENSNGLRTDDGRLEVANLSQAFASRPELKLLQNTIELSEQTTNMLKATGLPQVALSGGFAVTNPNFYNGFEKKFAGVWNVGVILRVPVWNWGDVKHKVNAAKGATTIANLELAEAREMIELQVNQSRFRVSEAYKKLDMANANIANAEENLRMANLGFREGTVSHTTVLEAQTAWQQAQTQKIEAEIGIKLAQVELQKAMGTL